MKSNKKMSRDEIREIIKKALNKELNGLNPKSDGSPNHEVLIEMITKKQMEIILNSISREEKKEEDGVSDE